MGTVRTLPIQPGDDGHVSPGPVPRRNGGAERQTAVFPVVHTPYYLYKGFF
jgi:hypothetical protein